MNEDRLPICNWNEYVLNLLERVRNNSIVLSNIHRSNYFSYKSASNFFDIPVIIISTLSGSFSVGATGYLSQEKISLVTCGSSIIITILSSIKLYLNLTQNLENESNMSREFYTLAVDIFKIINLPQEQRGEDGIQYLNKKYNQYIKLVETSNLLRKRYKHDQLAIIKKELLLLDTSSIDSYEYDTSNHSLSSQSSILSSERSRTSNRYPIRMSSIPRNKRRKRRKVKRNTTSDENTESDNDFIFNNPENV